MYEPWMVYVDEETKPPSAKLVAADGTRIRTAQFDGAIAAYVAYEIQADGTGYIDYLGVRADVRRRGLGRSLVADVCSDLAADGVSEGHLTVRADVQQERDLLGTVHAGNEDSRRDVAAHEATHHRQRVPDKNGRRGTRSRIQGESCHSFRR